MTEKGLIRAESFDMAKTRRPGVDKKPDRVTGLDFGYVPTPEDQKLIADLEAKIEKIKFNLENPCLIMTLEDKQKEQERQASVTRADENIRNIFGDKGPNFEVGKDKEKIKTSKIIPFINAARKIFTEPKRLRSLFGAGIAAMGIGRAALTVAESGGEGNTETTIKTEGEMPSQKSNMGSETTSEVSPVPAETYTVEQVKDSIINGPEVTPLPTAKVEVAKEAFKAWKERDFGSIEAELRLKGGLEKRVLGDARVIYCLRNSKQFGNLKLQDYLTEEEVVAHCKGEENKKVIYCKDKEKFIWLVVADKKIEEKAMKGAKDAIKWYKDNEMPDMLESAVENGLCVLFSANTHPERRSSSMWLNRAGVICLNQCLENTKKLTNINWRNQYISALFVEPYGILFHQISEALNLFDNNLDGAMKNSGNVEVIKSLIAGYIAEVLKGKDKDRIYETFADEFSGAAVNFARDYAKYGVTVDGPQTKRFLALMADFVRIPGFGSLKNVPTYNMAMTIAKN